MRKAFLLLNLFLVSLISFAQFTSNTFAPKVDFSTGSSVQGLALADLNGDGLKEILTANINSNYIGVYVNSTSPGLINSSSFSTNFSLITMANQPQQVFPGDINGDGKMDFVVGYSSGNYFSLFVNNYTTGILNSSSFTRMDLFNLGITSGVTIADFNNDGKNDLGFADFTNGKMNIRRNTSISSTNISFSGIQSYPAGSGPNAISAGYIDGDNKLDVVVTNVNSNTITVYRNTTNNPLDTCTFTAYTAATQSAPYWARVVNIDSTSNYEIVCSNYNSNSVSVFKNTTSIGINLATRMDLTVSGSLYTQSTTFSDFNGDQTNDIAVAWANTSNISVFQNFGSGSSFSLSSLSSNTQFPVGSSPVGSASGDLDGDLRPDLIVGNYGSSSLSILKNRILFPEPSILASNINYSVINGNLNLNFTKGNGAKRVVIARLNSTSEYLPVDSQWYTPNDTFGLGSNLGNGNYIVYSDTGSTVSIKGLTPGQSYTFKVIECNGNKGFSNYNTLNAPFVSLFFGEIYYSKSTGLLNNVATWGKNLDGSGLSPTSFNNSNSIYIVANNPAPSINSNWIVSGSSSFIIIGDGLNALNFTIPTGTNLLSDSIAIKPNATLTFVGGLISNKVFFDSASTAQFISSSTQNIPGFNYYNLIAANGSKTLSNNVIVKNSLNLLTNINTGSYILTLGISNQYLGLLNRNANGTITGKFRRWFGTAINSGNSGLFPMVVGTNYRPALVEFTSSPTIAGTLTVEYIATQPGNLGLPIYDFSYGFVEINKTSVNGYWKIDPLGITGGNYTITLTGTGIYGVNTVSDLRIVKRQTSGAWVIQGTAIPGTGTTAIPVVSRSGMSGFGEFTISGDSTVNPLPVKWLSFEGKVNENEALLNWRTVNEINNSHFVIERLDENNSEFKAIGKVISLANSGIRNYQFIDRTIALNSTYLYRIKQVDYDGKFSFSNIILVGSKLNSTDLSIGPNPADNFIYLSSLKGNQTFEIVDITGKVQELSFDGLNTINLEKLTSGNYILRVFENEKILKTFKIIKK